MGLMDLFSPSANLRGITDTENIFVSEVIQKTFINVHENGTEAAAATGRTLILLSTTVVIYTVNVVF